MPQLYKRPSRLVRRRKPTPVKPKPRASALNGRPSIAGSNGRKATEKPTSLPASPKPRSPRKSAYPQASKNRAWEFDSKRNAWVSVPKYPNVTKTGSRGKFPKREYEDFKPPYPSRPAPSSSRKPIRPKTNPPKQKPTPGYTWVWDVANSRWVQRRK